MSLQISLLRVEDEKGLHVSMEILENGVGKWKKEVGEKDEYVFHEVSLKELHKARMSKQPGLVYKKGNRYFLASIPGNLRLIGREGDLKQHLCGKSCGNLWNDCPRARELTVFYQMNRLGRSFEVAVKESWRIEKYKFITEGLEAFNMENNRECFVVLQCKNFDEKHKEAAPSQIKESMVLGLAGFMWPDFSGTKEELQMRIMKNEEIEREEK